MKLQHLIPLLCLVVCFTAGAQTNSPASTPAPEKKPAIFDESADGSKQIAEALAKAAAEHKHVLLMFGANYCSWCHQLHGLFTTSTNIAPIAQRGFVVVMIDVKHSTTGKIEDWHNGPLLTKYNPDYKGIPFLVVLDANGKQLTTQDDGNTDKLEEDKGYNSDKVMAFLKKWSPRN